MPIDIAQNIQRFEAGDTFQFTLSMTPSPPTSVGFILFNTDGRTLALDTIQPNEIVSSSASGLFYINRVLPQTPGIYAYKWMAWDTASRPYVTPGEFEVARTEAFSFATYGDPQDIVRSARGMFGRGDITFKEMAPYCQAADGYMDMYFGKVATVPLGSASPLIADMSKVYTLWRFYCDQYAIDTKAEPPAIIHRKEDYDKLLMLIAAGSASLPGIDTTVELQQVHAIPDGSRKAVFDMRDFIDQRVSNALLEDEFGRDN